jgi:hypothetical protein
VKEDHRAYVYVFKCSSSSVKYDRTAELVATSLQSHRKLLTTKMRFPRCRLVEDSPPIHDELRLEINDANLSRRFKRFISFVQVRGVHEADGSLFKCSSAPVDMTEQMNSGLLLFDRIE